MRGVYKDRGSPPSGPRGAPGRLARVPHCGHVQAGEEPASTEGCRGRGPRRGLLRGRGLAARGREGGLRRYLEYTGVCPQEPGPRAGRRAPLGPGQVRSPACWGASCESLSGLEKLPPLVPRRTETAQGTHVESWGLPRPLLSHAVDTLRVSLGTGTNPRHGVGAHRPRSAMQTCQCQPIST